jgi:two-component system CAI-1 autoinducer sensor kinase/phosphatase CqsS
MRAAIQYLAKSFTAYHAHAPFRIRAIAWVGVVAFPLYYVVWKYLFPQPYENLTLRLIAAGLCLALALADHWPQSWRRHYYLFTYVMLLFTLPFLFTFMILMNDANYVWQMSAMAALLFIALLYDTANMIISVLLGILLGVAAFLLAGDPSRISYEQVQTLPIIVFTLFVIRILLSFNDRFVEREKMRAAKTLAGHIAHEMRTPLLGVQFDATKARQYLPTLLSAYEFARGAGWTGAQIPRAQLRGLAGSMDRICEHAGSANQIVDMLLVNARQAHVRQDSFEPIALNAVVMKAIDRFHFRPGERERLAVALGEDSVIVGNELLMIHVIFNLLKNAIKAVEPNREGAVKLSTGRAGGYATLTISDNGSGIPLHILDEIFTPFSSGAAAGTGSGMGLAFCKLVVEGFEGYIDCMTESGVGTTFVVHVPVAAAGTGANALPAAPGSGAGA